MSPAPTLITIIPTASPSSPTKILTLPHPRTNTPTRYLLHPTAGLHELTKITPPLSQPRSWLLSHPSPGYTLSDGNLYISTQLDPLFLLLPHLLEKEKHFLPLDDLLDALPTGWEVVLSTHRRVVEGRVRAVCEAIDAGDEKAYRLCLDKTRRVLAGKCQAMAEALPRSLEEEFVKKLLVKPVTAPSMVELEVRGDGVELEANGDGVELEAHGDGVGSTPVKKECEGKEGGEKRNTPDETEAALTHLLRLRVYLSHVKQIRLDSAVARSGDFSLKHGNDDEAADAKAEKKRKTEVEEAKKKKNVSRGIRELGKVNTRGMAKLTSFFKKKE